MDTHTLDNGCLKIITQSHKYGLFDHEEFIDANFNHKCRVPCDTINKLTKTNHIVNCMMDPGDLLIFNSLLVHGSASNKSKTNRKAVVCHVINNKLVDDYEVTKET